MLAFFIYGWSTSTHTHGQGQFKCPTCRSPRACDITQRKRSFTLFFIPVFPLGSSAPELVCRGCRGEFPAPEQIRQQYPSSNPFPWILGIGAFLLVGFMGLMFILAMTFGRKPEQIVMPAEKGANAKSMVKSKEPVDRSTPVMPPRSLADVRWPSAVAGAAAPAFWKMKADPPAKGVFLSAPKDLKIDVPEGTFVLFSASMSPYVAFHNKGLGMELWDWTKGERKGIASDPTHTAHDMALSDEGSWLAYHDVKEGLLAACELTTNRKHLLAWRSESYQPPNIVSGLPGNKVLVLSGDKKELTVWEPMRGVRTAHLPLPEDVGVRYSLKNFWGVSPGGRYAAFSTGKTQRLCVADLIDNQVAADIPLPAPRTAGNKELSLRGLGFSRDGGKLAGVWMDGNAVRVLCWDVPSGTLEGDNLLKISLYESFAGPHVEWADNSAFLIWGEFVINPKCELLGTAPEVTGTDGYQMRRVIDRENVLIFTGEPFAKSLMVRPLIEKPAKK